MTPIYLLTLASALVQVPGLFLLVAFLGVLSSALFGWHVFGRILVLLALLALYFSSTPLGARLLLQPLEDRYPPLLHPETGEDAPQAIVVLGGGEIIDPGRPVPEMANARTLMRLQAAAALAQQVDLPVVPSGGAPRFGAPSEAATMARLLRQSFHISNHIWLEDKSYNTAANARDSAILLRQHGIRRIYLVTSAVHMPRAMAWFRYYGLQPTPVPCDYRMGEAGALNWQSWLPRAIYEEISSEAMHEYAGLLWYDWKTRKFQLGF
ncbi:YdcF family protein [Candidatus Igneacidithiobacillus taiwanensis]|uniref:YdcF family protein n=1 Tax=Candidatus Igneacidithiobacillus taiwanensis TaxID=1945924 RepID=UPI0028A09579|nr:YdcF family protein [Candidatus Igneacidithiobacillus taiwanensis]